MQPWTNAQQSAQQSASAAHDAHRSAMQHGNDAAQRAAEQFRAAHQMGQTYHQRHPQPTRSGGFLAGVVKFVIFLVWLAVVAAMLPAAWELLRNR
ncbi:hypothetical protein [Verrucosispora sp. ts21]|uniref:hypothetical protein n=1 Tax=Verrucosispora sp. ts21 TaxID=2069341 RepID=UPI0011AED321|nr:hypothetical protein [Verrucosispora sp. ts21]